MKPSVKATLILSVVFFIGGLTGFIAGKLQDDRPARFLGPRLDPFRQEKGVNEHIENRLSKVYSFTDEQRLKVRTILKDAQIKYDALYQETRPALDQIRRAQQMAIRETMTPEQRVRFDKWFEERRKHRGDRGDRHHRNGGKDDRPPGEASPPAE